MTANIASRPGAILETELSRNGTPLNTPARSIRTIPHYGILLSVDFDIRRAYDASIQAGHVPRIHRVSTSSLIFVLF
jgi:hypothetical protein